MDQLFIIVKEYINDKKWAILLLAGLIGGLAYLVTFMLVDFDLEAIETLFESYPEEFLSFFGDMADMSNPYGFLTMEVFLFIWLYAGIYLIYSASSLMTQEIETKTIELALSKPITRSKFLGSKIVSLYIVTAGMMALAFLLISGSIISSQIFIDEGLYFDRLWLTYIVVVLFLGALSMIAFFGSTVFLKAKKAMVLGIVALFLMFFIDGFYGYFEDLENLKWFTVFHYYNPIEYLVRGDLALFIRDIIVLTSLNAVLVIGSLVVFNQKDIPN